MKKVILLRSGQIQSDSRVEKYLTFFKEKGIDYTVIGWDRTNEGIHCENTIYYKRKSGFEVGGFKAAFNRLFWFIFLIRTLCSLKEKPDFVHACDIDTAFPAAIYKVLFNRKLYLLFDVFDWSSHVLSAQCNKILLNLIKGMENFALHHSDKIIICEEERRAQIPNSERYDILVLPNIPMINDSDEIKTFSQQYEFHNDKITLSYVGWFANARFLDELLDVAEEGRINLLIAGYGKSALEERCKELSKKDNVRYYGRVLYSKGLEIMYNADLIYAMYCKEVTNHFYAAPNKYYEVMFLGKPIITTKGIIIGKKVEAENIGYTIDESKEELIQLINSINRQDILTKGFNSSELWKNKYSNYTANFLQNQYLPLLGGV